MGTTQSQCTQSQCCFEPAVPANSFVEVKSFEPVFAPAAVEEDTTLAQIPVLAASIEESASTPAEPAPIAPDTPVEKSSCASLAGLLVHSLQGEVVEGDSKEFQGAWEEQKAKCVHVISGSKMVMKSLVAGRSYTVSLSFRDGALCADINGSASAKLDETGTKLLWGDGDVWTRASLNGSWRDSETGAVYTIDGSTMSTPKKEGRSLSLVMENPGIFSVTLSAGKFTATLDPTAMSLDWNDGDVWVREWRNFLCEGNGVREGSPVAIIAPPIIAPKGRRCSLSDGIAPIIVEVPRKNRRCSLSGPDEHLVKTASTWLEKGGEAWNEDDIPMACMAQTEVRKEKQERRARKSQTQAGLSVVPEAGPDAI